MKNDLWAKHEIEPLVWAAMLIAEGRLSYYRACKTLADVLTKRTFEAIRSKLKPMVYKIRYGTSEASKALPTYKPNIVVAHGFLSDVKVNPKSKNFLVQAQQAAASAAQIEMDKNWPKDANGFRTSAIICEHANECPAECPCPPDCYCKAPGHTCGNRR